MQKTATFFSPSESAQDIFQENSFSTQVSDENKEASNLSTPEQRIKVKVKGKVHTFQLSTSLKKKERRTADSETTLNNSHIDPLPKFPQIYRPNTVRERTKLNLSDVVSKQQGKKVQKDSPQQLKESFNPSKFIFADMSFENENNFNMTFEDTPEIITKKQNENSQVHSKDEAKDTFVMKRTSKNKLIASNLNVNKSIYTVFNPNNLQTPKKRITSAEQQQTTLPRITPIKTNKPLTIITDEESNMILPSQKPSYFQSPQNINLDGKIREKIASLALFSSQIAYPKTSTNASNGPSFVFTSNGKKHIIKGPIQPLNMVNSQAKAFKFSDGSFEDSLPSLSTSLETKSLCSPKNDLVYILNSKKQPSSEVLDTVNNSRRPSSRFKPQEAILEKIFNPSNLGKSSKGICQSQVKKIQHNVSFTNC